MAYRTIQDIFASLNHSYNLDEIEAEWQKTWVLLTKNRQHDQVIYESVDLPDMTIIVKDGRVSLEITDLVGPYIWWSSAKSPSLSKKVIDKMVRSGFIRKHTHLLLLVEFVGNSKKAKAKAKADGKKDDNNASADSEFLEVVDD